MLGRDGAWGVTSMWIGAEKHKLSGRGMGRGRGVGIEDFGRKESNI